MRAAGTVLVVVAAILAMATANAQTVPAQALERAKEIVSGRCFLCHGMQGEAASELFPRLAGQNADYVAKQLANFQSGERASDSMRGMVEALTPMDMRALGEYFSRQKAEPHAVSDSRLAAAGQRVYRQGGKAGEVVACFGCHGERALGSETLPRLAGQVAAYLETQLRRFGSRARTNDNAVMHTIAAKMTEAEIKAVAEYLSTLD